MPRQAVKEAHYNAADRKANTLLRDLTVNEVLVDVATAGKLHGSIRHPRIDANRQHCPLPQRRRLLRSMPRLNSFLSGSR